MVKPALPLRYSGPLLCLALAIASQPLHAQQAAATDDDRTESEEAVFIPVEYRPPPWQVSVGVRMTGKAKVKFSQLGTVPNRSSYPGPTPNATAEDKDTQQYKDAMAYVALYGRTYDDGSVSRDYTLDVDGTRIEPTDGKTNYWAFTSSDQVVTLDSGSKALALHTYDVLSNGDTASASNGSSLGWDVEISRTLGSSRRMSWGVLFGAGIGDVNSKTSGTVHGKLRTLTDYFSLDGVTLPSDLSNGFSQSGNRYWNPPVYEQDANGNWVVKYEKDSAGDYVLDEDGNKIVVYETDADGNKIVELYYPDYRLPTDPFNRTDITADTADIAIEGYWQVKGAYMTARFGPFFAYEITPHLTVRASAGVTLAVLGARFYLNEKAYIPALDAYMNLTNEKSNIDATVTGTFGYFVAGELDAYLTNRTGLFVGASYEDYSRDVTMKSAYGHEADLSLSSGTVIRTGIITRF